MSDTSAEPLRGEGSAEPSSYGLTSFGARAGWDGGASGCCAQALILKSERGPLCLWTLRVAHHSVGNDALAHADPQLVGALIGHVVLDAQVAPAPRSAIDQPPKSKCRISFE